MDYAPVYGGTLAELQKLSHKVWLHFGPYGTQASVVFYAPLDTSSCSGS